MRFEKVELQAYGRHRGRVLEGLSTPRPIVVLGDNESGKTTLVEALVDLLYGFPQRSRERHPRAPWDGGALRIGAELVADSGGRLRVERRLDRRAEGSLVRDGAQRALGSEPLPGLPLARERFLVLHALGRDVLVASDAALKRATEARLEGGVEGAEGPRQVALALRREAEKLWRPDRRGKPLCRELEEAIAAAHERRRAAEADDRRRRALDDEVAAIEARVTETAARIEESRTRRRRLEKLRTLARAEDRVVQLRRAAGAADLEQVPKDPRPLLSRARSRLRDVGARAEDSARLLHERRRRREQIEAASALEGRRTEIESLLARATAAPKPPARIGIAGAAAAALLGAALGLAFGGVPGALTLGLLAFVFVPLVLPRLLGREQGGDEPELARRELEDLAPRLPGAPRDGSSVEGWRAALDRAVEAGLELPEAVRAHEEAVESYRQVRADLVAATEASRRAEASLSEAAGGVRVPRALKRIEAARRARARLERLEARIAAVSAPRRRALARLGSAPGRSEILLDRHISESARLAETLERSHAEALSERAALAAEQERLRLAPRLSDIDGEIACLEDDLEALRLRRDRLVLAARAIELATKRFADEARPTILAETSKLLGSLTAGRYVEAVIDEDDDEPGRLLVVSAAEGRTVHAGEALSLGTRAQIGLALRLGALERLDRKERLPLILDEPFVDWDTARRQEGVRALAPLARTRQVIVTTCHPAFARELSREAGAKVLLLSTAADAAEGRALEA